MRFTKRGSKRVAILGCGPAGLFAAHAMIKNGWAVKIFSKKRPSHLYGAQYLHAPIPGLTPDKEPVTVKYNFTGLVDDYREKVYGLPDMQIMTSVQALESEHPGWDLRATYAEAWDRYEHLIVDQRIDHNFLGVARWDDDPEPQPQMPALHYWDLIVSTIPLPSICYHKDSHQFHGTRIWAYGDAPDRGQRSPIRPVENTVECNGSPDVGWYRASNIYGHVTVEWPANKKPPLPGVAEVTKPIYTDCNCYRDGMYTKQFIPLGRYGQWSKGVLTHQVYTQAAQL